ncbi:hypothetical protein [Isoptericola sp. NPDC019482]|uniref:hypothetical protein n=1 Tax=Isoptericola sp. NPDC019482 TaxID=3154688 RepID=UPI00347A335E
MPAPTSDDATPRPHPRWDPGARYRPSVLAGLPSLRPVQHVTTGLVRVVGRALGR